VPVADGTVRAVYVLDVVDPGKEPAVQIFQVGDKTTFQRDDLLQADELGVQGLYSRVHAALLGVCQSFTQRPTENSEIHRKSM
jgi:hypothetical protein